MQKYFNESMLDEEALLKIASEEGERTKITENVLNVANEIDKDGKLSGIELVESVCSFVQSKLIPTKDDLVALHRSNPDTRFDKRVRSADELLSLNNIIPDKPFARNLDGCTDIAPVARALLLAKGIPCVFTDTLEEDWLNNEAITWVANPTSAGPVRGHSFLDVYIIEQDKWITIDPVSADETVHAYQDYSRKGRKYVNPITGKDSADIGFPTMAVFLDTLAKAINDKEIYH